MPKIINYSNYIGKTFNHLTLVKDLGFKKDKDQLNRMFMAKCNICNSIKEIMLYDVKAGRIKSCGCQPPCFKHGLAYNTLYIVLSAMKTRCYNTKSKPYKNYGGRGITICNECLNDVSAFYKWGINNGYKEGLEIDRINNDGNYEPSNCRWATTETQARNRRTNKYLEFNGLRLTVSEWCIKLGLSRHGISTRLRLGWTVEEAVTRKHRYHT